MEPFSLRHGKALQQLRVRVLMKDRLRGRLWQTIQKFNEYYSYQPDPSDSWESHTSHLEQTEKRLKRLLGMTELSSPASEKAVGIEGYFLKGYPSCALDVIEQFVTALSPDRVSAFQSEVNDSMVAFECPWRLSSGRFFQIDASFFQNEIVQKAEDLLCERGFEGAHNEFREAREDLIDGAMKDTIVKAFNSYESTLKTATNENGGDVGELLSCFRKAGFMDDIPTDKAKAITKALASIAILRNELGGHGQGNAIVDVPRPYAVLAVHLAGALNQFVLSQHLRKSLESPVTSATPEEQQ